MKLFLLILTVYIGFIISGVAKAQDPEAYQPISYPALAKMVWRYQTYKTDNDNALDEFIRISNCNLYNKYFENDFLWGNIREGVRRDLDYYSYQLPNRFEIKTAIPLGRYNFDRAAYVVDDAFKMDNAGSIEIPISGEQAPCGTSAIIPGMMKFAADNKFALYEIPVPVNEAEQLLNKIKKYRYEGVFKGSDRTLAARFRISINGVRLLWNKEKSETHGVVFQGQLDEIAFFSDPEMTDLVWRKPFVELENDL